MDAIGAGDAGGVGAVVEDHGDPAGSGDLQQCAGPLDELAAGERFLAKLQAIGAGIDGGVSDVEPVVMRAELFGEQHAQPPLPGLTAGESEGEALLEVVAAVAEGFEGDTRRFASRSGGVSWSGGGRYQSLRFAQRRRGRGAGEVGCGRDFGELFEGAEGFAEAFAGGDDDVAGRGALPLGVGGEGGADVAGGVAVQRGVGEGGQRGGEVVAEPL